MHIEAPKQPSEAIGFFSHHIYAMFYVLNLTNSTLKTVNASPCSIFHAINSCSLRNEREQTSIGMNTQPDRKPLCNNRLKIKILIVVNVCYGNIQLLNKTK